MNQDTKEAFELISKSLEQFEKNHLENTRLNVPAIKFHRDIAVLFGFTEIEARLVEILKHKNMSHSLKNSFHNFSNSEVQRLKAKPLSLTPYRLLQERYPVFSTKYAKLVVGQQGEIWSEVCLSGRFDEALNIALGEKDDLATACVINSIAVLGSPELASKLGASYLSESRQKDANMVFAIEFSRAKNETGKKETIQKLLQDKLFYEWEAGQLALGISDKVPWAGYPYPDY